ncbi:MAG: AAA family ATPase [Burkholderiales bacterium]|jgi:MoxR-like ATPase|nr:AAA family ATPase [Burkholderiales bacterium]
MPPEIRRILDTVGTVVLGKPREVRLVLACLLARGHLLIEDVPGVGKTTLAQAMARSLGLGFKRVQFTADLLPADVVGTSVFDRDGGTFRFVEGPVFTQVLLADEVNRATPKAQSALLEAMEERQVTFDGVSRPLPEPFFVIATQNPSHQIGTFPLPESQLDRFLMRIALGYPDAQAERALLAGDDRRALLAGLASAIAPGDLLALQARARAVHAAPALLDYLHALITHSRRSTDFAAGLSPRAGIALLAAARAWALIDGRAAVLPEDVQAVLPSVTGHRLAAVDARGRVSGDDLAARLANEVAIP